MSADLREQLATARAFAKAAASAPMLQKPKAIEQMVAAMLDTMDGMLDVIEQLEQLTGENHDAVL